jgi:hypothetical protein
MELLKGFAIIFFSIASNMLFIPIFAILIGGIALFFIGGKQNIMQKLFSGGDLKPIGLVLVLVAITASILSGYLTFSFWHKVFSGRLTELQVLITGPIIALIQAYRLKSAFKTKSSALFNRGDATFNQRNSPPPNNQNQLDNEDDIQVF